MLPQRRRTACAVGALGLSLALSGCVPQHLAFRVDDRLTFTSPEDRATVRLPLRLDWEMRDFDVTGPTGAARDDAGYFAVFIDRSPMPPGEPLRWIARNDHSCRADDGCPDAAYFASRGIYTATESELVINQVPRHATDKKRERHRATVILLDAASRRIGESAFEIAFDVERTGS